MKKAYLEPNVRRFGSVVELTLDCDIVTLSDVQAGEGEQTPACPFVASP